MKFDLKNGYKNELKDNNEKSYSWSRNRVSHKIDFKAQWAIGNDRATAMPTAWELIKIKKKFRYFFTFFSMLFVQPVDAFVSFHILEASFLVFCLISVKFIPI